MKKRSHLTGRKIEHPPTLPPPRRGEAEENWEKVVKAALSEDIGAGDLTAKLIPEALTAAAEITAREKGIISGLKLAKVAFQSVDRRVNFQPYKEDGQGVLPGECVARVSGPARAILSAERTVLNFLSRLSGIATLTDRFVKEVSGTGAKIYDTRKTTPLMRTLEKYAVKSGGGKNHRFGLFDAVLIKDNHITATVAAGAAENRPEAIALLVQKAKKTIRPHLSSPHSGGGRVGGVEVEVENQVEVVAAAKAGANIIMLDNMSPSEISRVRRELKKTGFAGEIEVSGGVNLKNVKRYAQAGADRISVGRLTHSAPALDFSLEIT